ncbi:MAG: hypothetical protein IIT68_08360 [Treponema sp.]|nr:hypothetical protein [Treponema sp.]
MKAKLRLVSFLLLLSCARLSAVSWTNGAMNYQTGEEVKSPVDGKIVQLGNKGLPECFGKDSVVIEFSKSYYYDGQKQTGTYQLILSGLQLSGVNGTRGAAVSKDEVLGLAVSSPVMINVRCKDFDVYLVDCADKYAEKEDDWYYFGVGMFLSSSPKFLEYQPVSSKTDEIEFWDYPDTMENLYENHLEGMNSENKIIFMSQFPSFQICIKTQLDSYPSSKTQSSVSEGLMLNKYFSNCPVMLNHSFDELPFRLYFQKGFDEYLEDEYELGSDIYLYLSVILLCNGDYCCYVRDFSLVPPEENVQERIRNMKQRLGE